MIQFLDFILINKQINFFRIKSQIKRNNIFIEVNFVKKTAIFHVPNLIFNYSNIPRIFLFLSKILLTLLFYNTQPHYIFVNIQNTSFSFITSIDSTFH